MNIRLENSQAFLLVVGLWDAGTRYGYALVAKCRALEGFKSGEHSLVQVVQLYHETIGEDLDKWKTFTDMSVDWTGTFGELLDTVRPM